MGIFGGSTRGTILGGFAGGGAGALAGNRFGNKIGGPFADPEEEQNPYSSPIQRPDFYKELQDFSKDTGPSIYASALLAKQGQGQAAAADAYSQRFGAERSQAMDRLKQSGGLTSGARERFANANMGQGYGDLLRQGQEQRMDILAKDLGTKQNLFLQLPNMQAESWGKQQMLNLGQKQAAMLWQQAQDQNRGLLAKLPGELFGGLV